MKNEKIIKIAVLAEEPLGWGSGKHYFPTILNNYSWKKNDKKYRFKTEYIYDKDIIKGSLISKKYDVLLIPGGGVGDGEAITKGLSFIPKNKTWKKQIKKFIEKGGGFVGICGGVACFTGLDCGEDKKPTSFLEKTYDKSNTEASCVKHFYRDLGFPLLYLFQRKHPEKTGAPSYVFSFAPGETTDGKKIHTGGVPVDFVVSKNNPLFKDYPEDTVRIRWWGGPALTIPDNCKNNVDVAAYFPKKDFSEQKDTKIYSWSYTGGVFGLVKAFFESLGFIKEEKTSFKDLFMLTYFFARPWKKTKKNVKLFYSDKPSITTEEISNENKGRIVLCTSHPEYMIWHDGFIHEKNESDEVCLATGFRKWKNIKPLSETLKDELTHTWWIVRRMAAWAGKVPDSDLPPIKKGKITTDAEKIIEKNILWDNTLIDQIKNI